MFLYGNVFRIVVPFYMAMMGLSTVVTCPNCGVIVESPTKTWSLPRRASRSGEESGRVVGMFVCPSCQTRFRASFEKPTETASVKSVVENLKGIQGEFVNTLKNLREKLQKLEGERSSLLVEIDELKKAAESKANAIENEITMLRDEVKSLKELLGYSEGDNE